MPLMPNFVGPSYQARSPNADAEATINLILETSKAPGTPKAAVFYGAPCQKFFTSVTAQGCRGVFSQDGRTWTVVGANLYEVNTTTPGTTLRGSAGAIPNDGAPVSFASNGVGGNQLAIVGGGTLSILNLLTHTLTAVTLPLTNAPVVIVFIDGYFVLLEADTVRVWFSALENGLSWNALDFFARSHTSDNNVGLVVLRDRLWVFGSASSEVYYDSGDATTPFIAYPGSLMMEGAITPWGIMTLGEAVLWLSQDNQGRARIVGATSYVPQRVSTPAIDYALASYPTLADVEVLAYEQEGHAFAIWTCPSGDTVGVSWALDQSEGQWHQRAGWDSTRGQFTRWRARGCASTDAGVLVGDYATGTLSLLDLNTFRDGEAPRKWVRRAPYLSAENAWIFLDQIELGMQSGVGLTTITQGYDPEVMLCLSKDGGHVWGPIVTAKMGKLGRYLERCVWRKLGRARADRLVIEISGTDPVRVVLGPGLWITATSGEAS